MAPTHVGLNRVPRYRCSRHRDFVLARKTQAKVHVFAQQLGRKSYAPVQVDEGRSLVTTEDRAHDALVYEIKERVSRHAGFFSQYGKLCQRLRDDGRALGIAVSGYSRSLSAGIADISVDRTTGVITVHNYYGVGDAGFIVSPRNARAQVIGSIVFGLSSALTERITIKDGAVQETNFHQHCIMRMNEMPNIEVRIPSTDYPPSGVGELGLAMVGPSIANALFRLTGKRVRHLPLTAEIVSQALES